jgi:hypothetical protein
MRKVVLVLSVILLASCGGGVRPDSSITKQKGYDPNEDFLMAIGSPLYLFSLKYQAKPLDFPEDNWKKLSEEERLMVCLDYYTPQNVVAILDRVNAYLAKAKAELPQPQYEKLIPQTNQMKIGNLPMMKVRVERSPNAGSAPIDPARAVSIYYGSTGGLDYIQIPFPEKLEAISDQLWNKRPSYEEWLVMASSGFEWDNIKVGLDDKWLEICLPIEAPYIQKMPVLAEFESVIQEADMLWKAFNNFNTYGANLKTLKSDPKNPIRRVMLTFKIREGLESYIKKNVSPKNQAIFKTKAEAFMKSWGI